MRPTRTLLGQETRNAVLNGVNAIYEPVRRTFGPQGRNALLYRTFNRGSRITNDGHTVAQCQEPKNVFERLVATSFRESCKKTNELVGDGTTLTTIVGGVLMNDVMRRQSGGKTNYGSDNGKIGVMTLRKNILDSATLVKEKIKSNAKKVESLADLEKIAIVSVEDIEIGKVVAKMVWEAGVDGHIDVVEGYKGEIETDLGRKGMRFPAKIAAKGFINNPAKYEMSGTDLAVFITNYELDNPKQLYEAIQPFLEKFPKMAIVAPKFSPDVINDLYNATYAFVKDKEGNVQRTKNKFDFFPVYVPSLRTEQFEDLAVYCGAKFVDKNKSMTLKGMNEKDLGFIDKLIVKDTENKEDAFISGGAGLRDQVITDYEEEEVTKGGKKEKRKVKKEKFSNAVHERIEILKSQIKETPQDQFKKLLERRIASMGSALGIIRVGDSTEASALYKKLKIEDAVYASKAALRGGYVKGGGLCLKEIAEELPDGDILKGALLAPYKQIQSSVDGGIEITADIIDPMEVNYYAIEHATSVIATLATVDIITQELEDPLMGEGEYAIARALNELAVNDKIHKGQINESEREAELDRMGGLTIEEMVSLDQG
jgi:chaperonin GroEL